MARTSSSRGHSGFKLRSGNASPLKNPGLILRGILGGAKALGRYVKNPKGLLKDTAIYEGATRLLEEIKKANKNKKKDIVDQDRPGRHNKYGVGTPKI